MKKLLVLMQSVFLATAAITPALVSHQEKAEPMKVEKVFSSVDMLDLTFRSKDETMWVATPNLFKLLDSYPAKGSYKYLIHMDFSLTASTGEKIEVAFGYNDTIVWNWGLLFEYMANDVYEPTYAQVGVSSKLDGWNGILGHYKDKYTPIFYYTDGLGSWGWQNQAMMDAFLTKDVKLAYQFYFSESAFPLK